MSESKLLSAALELVTKAQAGDLESFESLVGLYEKRIYNIAYRLLTNEHDAEDVLQETFLKAYQNLGNFRQESSFYTWIVQIAVNAALQNLKKRQQRPTVSLDELEVEDDHYRPKEIAIWEETPESLYSQKQLREILHSAIDTLPVIYRTVFLLKDVEGLPVQQIADILGLTLPAAKSRLIRARLELRDYLNKYFKKAGAPVYSADHVH